MLISPRKCSTGAPELSTHLKQIAMSVDSSASIEQNEAASLIKRREDAMLNPQADCIKILPYSHMRAIVGILGPVSVSSLHHYHKLDHISEISKMCCFFCLHKKYMILNNFLISARFSCFDCSSSLFFACWSRKITVP